MRGSIHCSCFHSHRHQERGGNENSNGEHRGGGCGDGETRERYATDGEIISGESYVDESMVTGESIPVHKKVGENASPENNNTLVGKS